MNDFRVETPDRFQVFERGECTDGQPMQHNALCLNWPDPTDTGKFGGRCPIKIQNTCLHRKTRQ